MAREGYGSLISLISVLCRESLGFHLSSARHPSVGFANVLGGGIPGSILATEGAEGESSPHSSCLGALSGGLTLPFIDEYRGRHPRRSALVQPFRRC